MNNPDDIGAERYALLLVRTPFQAWIAERIIYAETVSHYDVLYLTQHDSPEDRHYYKNLSDQADDAQYCVATTGRFDILNDLHFRRQTKKWNFNKVYDLVLLASINSHILTAISSRQVSAELVTFDDGLANIMPSGMYSKDVTSWRNNIYGKLLEIGRAHV